VEKDVEQTLRGFQTRKEMANMTTISGNLQTMARELEDAQDKAEKLGRKAGKASAAKVDAATSRLENAQSQWDSQAPFVFETLQALDEQRINQLRDALTQLETHEVDQATRSQSAAEEALSVVIEINTELEVQSFAARTTADRPKLERRMPTRQSSIAGASLAPPSAASHDDNVSEHSGGREPGHGGTHIPTTGEHQGQRTYLFHRIKVAKPHRYHAGSEETEHPWRIWAAFTLQGSRAIQ